MRQKTIDDIVIEGARIIYRNFKGEKTKFNQEGSRNFCIVIDDPKLLSALQEDGWNIKIRAPREDGDEPMHYLQVAVSFDNFPPFIERLTKRSRVQLFNDTVAILDTDEIVQADLVIRPYEWEVNGKTGVKAYLKEAKIVAAESEFAAKYEHWGEE